MTDPYACTRCLREMREHVQPDGSVSCFPPNLDWRARAEKAETRIANALEAVDGCRNLAHIKAALNGENADG